jgi:energy-coupling factor transporter transmembrane protein EcfT
MSARRLFPIVLPWLLLLAVGLFTAWLRYGFIEPPELAHRCDDANGPAWCGVRAAIVIGFNSYGFGIAAIIVTALSLIWKKPWLAWLAAALGALAVILYCFYAGAFALLVGSLRLVRLQTNSAMMTPRHPHRRGNRQIQAQP